MYMCKHTRARAHTLACVCVSECVCACVCACVYILRGCVAAKAGSEEMDNRYVVHAGVESR